MSLGIRRGLQAIDFIPANGAGQIIEFGGVGGTATTGETVTPETALNVSAYWRGLNLIANTTAMLPLLVYRDLDPGKQRAKDHHLYQVLRRKPNPEMSSFTWRQTMAGHVVSWGNAYNEKVRDGLGRVREIWPLRPDRMTVERERLTQQQLLVGAVPRRRYRYRLASGEEKILRPQDVLHIRGLGFDGLVGYPVLTLMRNTLGLTMAAETYGAKTFANGARPGVILRHPKTLSTEARENLASSWHETQSGLNNAQRTAVLEEGIEVTTLGFPPDDAQFLATRQFQVVEFARWIGLPPHKLYELSRATFSNIEQQALEYLSDSMNPWLVNIEQQLWLDLFEDDDEHFPEFERNALMQIDAKSRAVFYNTMRWLGVMNGDDIASRENLNPLPDGKGQIYMVPMNMRELGGDEPLGPSPAPSDIGAMDPDFTLMELTDRVEALEAATNHNGSTP